MLFWTSRLGLGLDTSHSQLCGSPTHLVYVSADRYYLGSRRNRNCTAEEIILPVSLPHYASRKIFSSEILKFDGWQRVTQPANIYCTKKSNRRSKRQKTIGLNMNQQNESIRPLNIKKHKNVKNMKLINHSRHKQLIMSQMSLWYTHKQYKEYFLSHAWVL